MLDLIFVIIALICLVVMHCLLGLCLGVKRYDEGLCFLLSLVLFLTEGFGSILSVSLSS